ncbi:baseplate J/gp47 family protein [Sulfitobacter sp. OXR-159]|uniref:baseplate assembly protein n=1 Tax=Sulfitobacter sp. OXR-159 TaxID=3100174 RepID=UPI002AC8A84C|nr:baseplate J/gp47 family protein [Sulfitobacter sp. OXR-159]WPZ28973.1 baseplate J/gp47 family protein [Sulfitobacter sp. OXR-159]
MSRFVDIDLARLPAIDAVKALDYEGNLADRMARFTEAARAVGIEYDASALETDPAVILMQVEAYFDILLKQRVNDAAKSVRLAYASGHDLEHIAAEFGVARFDGESDASLRRRRQLAVEALSTAGPEGAYLFFALAAHPNVGDAAIYGPQSGLCAPGQVLVVTASKDGNGVPVPAVLDAVANSLDARTIKYADYTSRTRQVTRQQAIRPLTDWVIIEAANDYPFTIDAVLQVPYGPDMEVVRRTALTRLGAYLDSRRKVGMKISDSAIAAALHVTDTSGAAIVDDVNLYLSATDANGDIDPGPKGIARAAGINVEVEVLS